MRERSIVVAESEEVRALLAGKKTRFHCPMRPQPMLHECGIYKDRRMLWSPHPPGGQTSDRKEWERESPFGVAGDRLWVKEAWAVADYMADGIEREDPVVVAYRADLTAMRWEADCGIKADTYAWNWDRLKWKSPVAMPRWACRTVLEVTSVVARPAEDITEAEILAAGITVDVAAKITCISWSNLPTLHHGWRAYWDYRFWKTAPWSSEPWEFAATVKVVATEERR